MSRVIQIRTCQGIQEFLYVNGALVSLRDTADLLEYVRAELPKVLNRRKLVGLVSLVHAAAAES